MLTPEIRNTLECSNIQKLLYFIPSRETKNKQTKKLLYFIKVFRLGGGADRDIQNLDAKPRTLLAPRILGKGYLPLS